MKIVVVTNLFPPYAVGGFEIRCEQVSRALAARGHQVVVLTSTSGVDAPRVDNDGLHIHRVLGLFAPYIDPTSGAVLKIERDRWARWRTTRRNYAIARELLQAEKPDLVFGWAQARVSLGAMRAAQDMGIPTAWTFGDANIGHYCPAPFAMKRGKLLDWFLDNVLLTRGTWKGMDFSHTQSLSAYTRDRIIQRGLPIHNCRIIYRGIPVDKFPLRDDLGDLHSPVRVLYVGQLQQTKGVHTVIEAVHRLGVRHGPGYARLTVVGEGNEAYKAELEKQAAASASAVEFRGKVSHSEVGSIYRAHDVFVFSSSPASNESFGATHLEAMASGLPVVGTLAGGAAELFVHNQNALVFNAEDAVDLADKLEQLIGDAALRRRLATQARVSVERDYDIATYVDKVEQFLIDACKRTPAHLRKESAQ